jgi:magnesium chelatase family protein
MEPAAVRRLVLAPDAERPLVDAYRRGQISARGRDRALRVARTVADLSNRSRVERSDVVTALGYRQDAASITALAS